MNEIPTRHLLLQFLFAKNQEKNEEMYFNFKTLNWCWNQNVPLRGFSKSAAECQSLKIVREMVRMNKYMIFLQHE